MKTQTRDALTAVLVVAQVAWATVAAAVPSATASRYAAIVIDAQTGGVLYERNADLPRQPASLTKIMTLYLTFEALSRKKIALTDTLPVSVQAASREPSRLGLTPGSRLKLEDAIRGMTTKSANDAASVVAEFLGKGSETHFAEMMTAKARTLGLKQTKFLNASGLPGQGHVSSARDLATLCLALVRDYPDYYRYFSTSAFEFKGKRYPNQNRFLRSYFGADGIKTGFVNASGHNLAASAVRGDKRLVAIVLGGDTQLWTREHATRLMDVAYAKIDPNLAFMASNAVNTAPVAVSTTTYATPAGAMTVAPVAASTTTYATPAGAMAVASAAAPATADSAVAGKSRGPDKTAPETGQNKPTTLTARLLAAVLGESADSKSTDDETDAQSVIVATATEARSDAVTDTPTATNATPAAAATVPAVAVETSPTGGAASNPAAASPAATNNRASASATDAAPTATTPAAAKTPVSTTSPADKGRAVPSAAATDAATPSPAASAKPVSAKPARGEWAVQVGLFRDESVARRRAEEARDRMPTHLRGADLVVAGSGDGVHLASRLTKLSEQDAREACNQLQRGSVPCVVIPPGRPMIVATN